MDWAFASWEFLDQMSQSNTLFVVRIKNNTKPGCHTPLTH